MTTTKRRLVRGSFHNILDCFERASSESIVDGGSWYPTARVWASKVGTALVDNGYVVLQDKYDHITSRIVLGAGIISALSPQTNWTQNKEMALSFAETLDKPNWCTDINYDKALRIVGSSAVWADVDIEHVAQILNGKKTTAFFYNIVNPYGENNLPTIDRHAISIYLGRRCTYTELVRGLSGTANKTISNAYIKASKLLDTTPQIVQAVTWVQWRKEIKGEV
tara:strand:- start:100 stop:768 length:669 start_codon:yes stop_codon:yes gene_type:complete